MMDNKEQFKTFVKNNPKLISYVKSGDMNWQKFYEIFDLYGEDKEAWKEYLTKEETAKAATAAAGTLGLAEIFNWIKNINLDNFQAGVNNLQRVVGVVQDLTTKKTEDTTSSKETYKPRPLYRHFED